MSPCAQCALQIETECDHAEESNLNLCEACTLLNRSDKDLYVSPLERKDLELVLAWRSRPDIYRYFQEQDSPLQWEEHISWFESRDSNRYDFMIHYDDRRVGVTSLSSNDEVTIYIGDISAQGQGVASLALNWLCTRFKNRAPLIAKVHEDNTSSKNLFIACGFERENKNNRWIQYIYEPEVSN